MSGPTTQTVRVAAIDIGSNSVRLQVADVAVGDDGRATQHEQVERRTTVTRLSQDVDRRGILLPEAITRTRVVLSEYRARARELGCVFVLATATSAVRDAENGEAFLGEIEYGYGFRCLLLSGDDEAAMTWRGAASDGVLVPDGCDALLVDIGGGSTELVVVRGGRVVDAHSFQLGCVRLTERHFADDPPTADQLAAAMQDVRAQLRERFANLAAPDLVLGVAGTPTVLAARMLEMATYDAQRIHGTRVPASFVAEELALGGSLSAAGREALVGMAPGRGEVILAGYVIMEAVLRHVGAADFVACERDILDGTSLVAGEIAVAEGIDELPEPHGRTVC